MIWGLYCWSFNEILFTGFFLPIRALTNALIEEKTVVYSEYSFINMSLLFLIGNLFWQKIISSKEFTNTPTSTPVNSLKLSNKMIIVAKHLSCTNADDERKTHQILFPKKVSKRLPAKKFHKSFHCSIFLRLTLFQKNSL